MRIIAGELRHRRLEPPPEGAMTRPIPDRVKESLFSILRGNCEGASVVDCFAGTGAIGLEAVSRGATRCVLVEQDKSMARVLERNIAELGVEERCEVVCADALGVGALARFPRPLDLAFFDPPYPMMEDPLQYRRIMAQVGATIALLDDDGFLVLRTPWPFFQTVQESAASAAPDTPPKRKKRPPRNAWRQQLGRGRDADADEQPEDISDEVFDEPPPSRRIEPSLIIPGAKGPETHVYGSMAIHLFMRAR